MNAPVKLPAEILHDISMTISSRIELRYRDILRQASRKEDSLAAVILDRLSGDHVNEITAVTAGIAKPWKWRFNTSQFGPRKGEPQTGADAIVTIGIGYEGAVYRKSVLIQSKKFGNLAGLEEQSKRLSAFRNAAVIVSINADAISIMKVDDYIKAGNFSTCPAYGFRDYMINQFAACLTGDWYLDYDANEDRLVWLTDKGEWKWAQFLDTSPLSISATDMSVGLDAVEMFNHSHLAMAAKIDADDIVKHPTRGTVWLGPDGPGPSPVRNTVPLGPLPQPPGQRIILRS